MHRHTYGKDILKNTDIHYSISTHEILSAIKTNINFIVSKIYFNCLLLNSNPTLCRLFQINTLE